MIDVTASLGGCRNSWQCDVRSRPSCQHWSNDQGQLAFSDSGFNGTYMELVQLKVFDLTNLDVGMNARGGKLATNEAQFGTFAQSF